MPTFVTLHLRKFAPWKMFSARKMHIGHFPGRTNSTGTCTTGEIHVCKYWQLETYIHPFTWVPGAPNSTQVVQLSLEWGHSNWHRLGERKAEIKFTAKLLLNKCLQCTDSEAGSKAISIVRQGNNSLPSCRAMGGWGGRRALWVELNAEGEWAVLTTGEAWIRHNEHNHTSTTTTSKVIDMDVTNEQAHVW